MGMTEAAREMKIKVEITPRKIRDIISGRSKVIIQKHCNDMEHAAYLNCLENIHRTPKEIIYALQRRLQKFKGAVK